MAAVFLQLYDFFYSRRMVFWSVFLGSIMLLGFGASDITLEEDISKFFPDDPRVESLRDVFQHSKVVERMVIMVSARDTTTRIPDSLVSVTEAIVETMEREAQPYVRNISSRVSDDKILDVYKTIHAFLPAFLNDGDYIVLDSLTRPENIGPVLQQSYRQLISPSGIALKRIIAEDPLGFSFLALRKLQQLQFDQNFELYDNYIVTKDRTDLIFFVEPVYPPQETRYNTAFIQKLNSILEHIMLKHSAVKVTYFGATAVAVGNARQLRNDSFLTITIMVVLLCVLLIGFFRKKRAPFIILIPVVFGAIFSLCCIYLIKSVVSVLALAAGSIILGIAVNYALHFLVHLRHTNNIREVIKDLANPLTLGSATTVLAFFCLQFANAAVLRDVGLFAGFSLIGAVLCSLIFLPHLVREDWFKPRSAEAVHDRGSLFRSRIWERRIVWLIFLITPVFFYFARLVEFNSDVTKLNFMTSETRSAQSQLESINRSSLGAVYVVSRDYDLEHALRKAEQVFPLLQGLQDAGTIIKFSSPTLFLVSDSLQQRRIEKWNAFWTVERKQSTMKTARQEGAALKFSDQVMQNLDDMISKSYKPGDQDALQLVRHSFFDDYIIEKGGSAAVMSLVNVTPDQKGFVYDRLAKSSSSVVDRQMLTNFFVEYIHSDFNLIVTITAILVFVALFLSYGRIELTLITFFPMFITWIWILGIMAFLKIEFNIINVMVSTFIFGLGDDYSIFIMDGLQQEYQTGKKSMPSIRTSIFLSAITTIAGLGVLIFARHPALRSIASISIIGIGCVLVMSQTIEPFLFRLLITDRTRKGLAPMTWIGMLLTLFSYCYFVLTTLMITLIGDSERTKKMGRYFKRELVTGEVETPAFFRAKLISNFLYKGPVLEWYLRIKLKLENNYTTFHNLLPMRGRIIDLGCGYGFMCYMLQFLSADRIITGVDYDEDKIETARHGYSRSTRLTFHHADVTQFPLTRYEAIVISDVLHYLTPEQQEEMLIRCFDALEPGGILIIRDGNTEMVQRHRFTKLTEFFSVKLLKFNKAVNELNFVSSSGIKQLATSHGLEVQVLDDAKFTSNVIFAVRKPADRSIK